MIDLRKLERPRSPNHFLASPADWGIAGADETSPAFSADWRTVLGALKEIALSEPRTRLTGEDMTTRRVAFCQRSLIFRFPDDIVAEIVELGDNKSTIAIYSASRCGYGDFGVNRRRMRRWLGKLTRALARPAPNTG